MADPPMSDNLASRQTPRNVSKSKRALDDDYPKTLTGIEEGEVSSSGITNDDVPTTYILKLKHPNGTAATTDLQLFYEEGEQHGKTGFFCNLCIANNKPKEDAFFTGNVSSRRTHISRNHYEEYLAGCKEKNIQANTVKPGRAEEQLFPSALSNLKIRLMGPVIRPLM
ncbi:hypothetical protein CVT24_001329 [Panaeolus cyanescens]|uniref:Uncharacterized protein n=1 Tax=Panaeolus cyanescens TaxID=181874 RepID=A0A409WXK6_9AGAR|nr:hypothetical protein CVT24_001329 [Panaeolus cyanescens]